MTSPSAGVLVRDARMYSTFELFVGVAILTAILAYYNNEAVMTRDVYHAVLGNKLEAARIDTHYELVRRWSMVGYFLSPILLAGRIGFMSLLGQLGLLLVGKDVSLGALYRLSIFAHVSLLASAAGRSIWLANLPGEAISTATLNEIPGSLAWFLLDSTNSAAPLYVFLSAFNLAELAWCVIVTAGLVKLAHFSVVRAAASAVTVWLVTELFFGALRALIAQGWDG